jgi:hypothetical protein
MPEARAMLTPWFALGAGRVFAPPGRSRHSFGVAITILYDALRHHAPDFTSIKDTDKVSSPKIGDAVLMQEDSEECFNRAAAFDQY